MWRRIMQAISRSLHILNSWILILSTVFIHQKRRVSRWRQKRVNSIHVVNRNHGRVGFKLRVKTMKLRLIEFKRSMTMALNMSGKRKAANSTVSEHSASQMAKSTRENSRTTKEMAMEKDSSRTVISSMRANGKTISIKEGGFCIILSISQEHLLMVRYMRILISLRITNGRSLKESLIRVNGMGLVFWTWQAVICIMGSSIRIGSMDKGVFSKKDWIKQLTAHGRKINFNRFSDSKFWFFRKIHFLEISIYAFLIILLNSHNFIFLQKQIPDNPKFAQIFIIIKIR